MFKSLRKEQPLITSLPEPPHHLRTPAHDELVILLEQLREFLSKCRHVTEISGALSRAVEKFSHTEDESIGEFTKAVDRLDEFDFDVPGRILEAMDGIVDCESRELSNFNQLLAETVERPSKKLRHLVSVVNAQFKNRSERIATILEVERKLAKYEREKFTNVKSWKITTLRKENAEMRQAFFAFENTLTRELRELLADCVKYFEPILQSFAAAELDFYGKQTEVIRDVSQSLQSESDAAKNSDFSAFFEEQQRILNGLGVISGIPAAART